ncbi:MAG: TetR/AcrR family transcriptional regulator [Phaeodactylibacter sp.]|nr:TetR/AcrR family transcriptional regulator [Phaeodactylibacter sp.]
MDIRTEIFNRSRALFMKYGLKSVTMDDIARDLGISKKTLYQFVDNKADLIQKVVCLFVDEEQESIDSIQQQADDAIEEMLNIARHIIRFLRSLTPTTIYDLQKYYKESWELVYELNNKHIIEVLKQNIEKGIRQGVYRENLNPEIIAKIYVGKIPIITDEEIFPGREYNREQLFSEFFTYHIHGIASQKGLQHLQAHMDRRRGNANEL